MHFLVSVPESKPRFMKLENAVTAAGQPQNARPRNRGNCFPLRIVRTCAAASRFIISERTV
jgi:hypothetical protein